MTGDGAMRFRAGGESGKDLFLLLLCRRPHRDHTVSLFTLFPRRHGGPCKMVYTFYNTIHRCNRVARVVAVSNLLFPILPYSVNYQKSPTRKYNITDHLCRQHSLLPPGTERRIAHPSCFAHEDQGKLAPFFGPQPGP